MNEPILNWISARYIIDITHNEPFIAFTLWTSWRDSNSKIPGTQVTEIYSWLLDFPTTVGIKLFSWIFENHNSTQTEPQNVTPAAANNPTQRYCSCVICGRTCCGESLAGVSFRAPLEGSMCVRTVVPKVCSTNPKESVITSQRIRGCISVMAT
jgi:hypothetical protein